MQLGLYQTTLAAARLSYQFKISRFGKMMNRGMKSRPDENSLNCPTNDKGGRQLQSWNPSQAAYDDEFPPLSANNSSKQGKRRTRIDLCTPSKQTSEEVPNNGPLQLEAFTSIQNIGPLEPEASTSISDQNDTDLFTSSGRNLCSRQLKLNETYHEHQEAKRSLISNQNDTYLLTSFGKNLSSRKSKLRDTYESREAKRSSMSSLGNFAGEPFDICLPETSKPNSLGSSVNDENRRKWIAKGQAADGNEKYKDDMEKSNETEDSVEEVGQVLRPGMVLLKHYIPLSEQVDIVNRCRELGCGPGGFYRPGYDDGAKLRLYMMCLGLDWNPQTKRYGERRLHDNAAPPDIPQEFTSLVCKVLDDSRTLIKRDLKTINVEDELPAMHPDVCIVNFYTTNGRLGLHQDRDESKESLLKGLPVVSVSVGDSAEFLYGDQRDVDKAERVLLESGDVLIFGGESRHIFHGVKTIIPDTAPPALLKNTKFRPGRLNLTFRKY